METNTSYLNQAFLSKIDPKVIGIIYLCDSRIDPHFTYFNELNYLTNNLLLESYTTNKSLKKTKEVDVIITESFKYPFFIMITNITDQNTKSLDDYLNLISKNQYLRPKFLEKPKLIIIKEPKVPQKSETSTVKAIQKKLTDFEIVSI